MKSAGRPKNSERRPELTPVGFKADPATLNNIEIIVAQARREGSVSPKSTAIRRAIADAADRIRGKR